MRRIRYYFAINVILLRYNANFLLRTQLEAHFPILPLGYQAQPCAYSGRHQDSPKGPLYQPNSIRTIMEISLVMICVGEYCAMYGDSLQGEEINICVLVFCLINLITMNNIFSGANFSSIYFLFNVRRDVSKVWLTRYVYSKSP